MKKQKHIFSQAERDAYFCAVNCLQNYRMTYPTADLLDEYQISEIERAEAIIFDYVQKIKENNRIKRAMKIQYQNQL